MFDALQYRLLKTAYPRKPNPNPGPDPPPEKSKLETLLGRELLRSVVGKSVIDFGCGEGNEAIELAKLGARKVVGIDIRPELLLTARKRAILADVSQICEFTTDIDRRATE